MPRKPDILQPQAPVGRLAMRHEGSMWNAYYALPDTLKNALFLGGVKMAIIDRDERRAEAFMELMRQGVADIIEEKTGSRPLWKSPIKASEPDRGGNV